MAVLAKTFRLVETGEQVVMLAQWVVLVVYLVVVLLTEVPRVLVWVVLVALVYRLLTLVLGEEEAEEDT
jgi:hypothetical protein